MANRVHDSCEDHTGENNDKGINTNTQYMHTIEYFSTIKEIFKSRIKNMSDDGTRSAANCTYGQKCSKSFEK